MNKSLVTNLISLLVVICGFYSPIFSTEIFMAGLFALSGGITNWIAIHMLFEKIPFFYGSGVIPERFEEFKSVSKTLDSYGLGNYERQSTNISARMPNSEEIASLKQPANRPVLITESVNVDSFGEPIEFGISAFSADRTNLIVES